MVAENRVQIERALCIGCGACISVCPTGTLSLVDGRAAVTGAESISCGHCEAVCPQAAVRVLAIDQEMSQYKTFSVDRQWLAPGSYDTSSLIRLMASRRSCRCFLDRPVDRAMLDDLIKIGITAPSGTNSQAWTFTVLPTRQAVLSLAGQIAHYFTQLNATAEKTLLRLFLKTIGKGELDAYFRGYYQKVKYAIAEWQRTGKDRLFHGSTAAIVVGSRPGASCPAADALLATQNILLGAHSMGLNSCLIGFAVAAMKKDPSMQLTIGIPPEEEIHAVIALGYADEVYQRAAGRKKPIQRYFEG